MIKLFLLLTSCSWLMTKTIEGTAHVQKISGIYIYTDSNPDEQYKVLGTIKDKLFDYDITTGQASERNYEDLRNDLILQAKKKYKECEGLLIDVTNKRADVIKFE
jgi:uncharacterized protein YueI